jgi:hypothetical protein
MRTSDYKQLRIGSFFFKVSQVLLDGPGGQMKNR